MKKLTYTLYMPAILKYACWFIRQGLWYYHSLFKILKKMISSLILGGTLFLSRCKLKAYMISVVFL